MIKSLIILFFFGAWQTLAITDAQIKSQLNIVPHGPNWKSIIRPQQKEVDRAAIRKGLMEILNDTDIDIQLRYNAFSEIGHFLELGSDGRVKPEDKKILDQFKTEMLRSNDELARVALFNGLKNIGAIDTTEQLIDQLEEVNDEVLVLSAARSLESSLRGHSRGLVDPSLDLSFMSPYHPNTDKPFYQRNGDWKQTFQRAQDILKKIFKKISATSQDASVIENLRILTNRLQELRNQGSQSEAPEPVKKDQTSINSIEHTRDIAQLDQSNAAKGSKKSKGDSRDTLNFFLIGVGLAIAFFLMRKLL